MPGPSLHQEGRPVLAGVRNGSRVSEPLSDRGQSREPRVRVGRDGDEAFRDRPDADRRAIEGSAEDRSASPLSRWHAGIVVTLADHPTIKAPGEADVLPIEHETRERIERVLVIGVPLIALGWAGWLAWGGSLHWQDLVVLAITYLLTGLGVTVGYHRLFTHRS